MDAECECGHVYDEHERGGPCAAYFSDSIDDQPCPCVHFDMAGSATPETTMSDQRSRPMAGPGSDHRNGPPAEWKRRDREPLRAGRLRRFETPGPDTVPARSSPYRGGGVGAGRPSPRGHYSPQRT
jgi:hypothetical protein